MKENKRRKSFALVLLTIASAGVVSMGVAGYVIGGNVAGASLGGNVNGAVASSGNITVTAASTANSKVFFGGRSDLDQDGAKAITWVADADDIAAADDNGNGEEDLTAAIAFSSTDDDTGAYNLNHHYTIAVTSSLSGDTVIGGYIASVVTVALGDTVTVNPVINGNAIALTDADDINGIIDGKTITADLTFAWGTTFGNVNPMAYYQTADTTSTDFADLLNDVKTALAGATFTVTVTPVID